jgi:glutamyl-tRNA reductase
MNIIVLGLNHKTAPVEIREKLAFSEDIIEDALKKLCGIEGIKESLILSTCNRVDILVVARDYHAGVNGIKKFLSNYHNIPVSDFEECLYIYDTDYAIKHIFKVASGLDSMVIGEPQIFGQIKDAYTHTCNAKTSEVILNKFLHKSFQVAKRIRTETTIGERAISVSYVAVELAKKIFENLQDKGVMLIGAGEMSELAMKHLISNGVKNIIITNRTYERAVEQANKYNGIPIKFEELYSYLKDVDIVISSTGSKDYILRYNDIHDVIKLRKNKPMFFIDIAVPRDIDPLINEIGNVYLYDIDDLQGVVNSNIKEREKEAVKAERIIEHEYKQFYKWLSSLSLTPVITSLRNRMEDIRRRELEKTLSKFKDFDDSQKKALDILTTSIVNKILHSPITNLKKSAETSEGGIYIDAIRKLFSLEEDKEDDLDNEE